MNLPNAKMVSMDDHVHGRNDAYIFMNKQGKPLLKMQKDKKMILLLESFVLFFLQRGENDV